MNANALGVLRFVLAMLVVWVHYEQLTGTLIGLDVTDWGISHLAVNCFFVLSGFLMPRSFEHARGIVQFYQKRFVRIYVAYFVVVTVVAVAAFAVSKCNISPYFNTEWLKYYSLNLLTLNFLKPDLSCLFQDHAIVAVNGSLWSIKVELMFYLCVPLVYWFHRWAGGRKLWYSAVLLLFALVLNIGFGMMALHTGSSFWQSMLNQLPAKLCFFLGGWYLFEVSSTKHTALGYGLMIGSGLGALAFIMGSRHFEWVHLPLCMSLVYLFFKIRVNSRRFHILFRFLGGLSYALYLTHFPLAQVLVALVKQQTLPSRLLLPCFALALLILSILLYKLESKILDYCKRKFKMD